MPLPALIAAGGAIAARVAPYVLALAPTIAEFFSGKGNDDEAAKKIAEARDGLAARISAAEGIPLAKAQAAVDEQLKPLVEQHARDAGSQGGNVVGNAASAIGGVLIGRGMGKGVGKLAKGIGAAEKAAVTEEGVLTARQAAQQEAATAARTGKMDRVRAVSDEIPQLGHTPAIEPEVLPPERPRPAYMRRENTRAMQDSDTPGNFQMTGSGREPATIDTLPPYVIEELKRRAALAQLAEEG